jgi:hypothetical protein
MAVLTAQYTIQMKSGVPADAVVNTFHFLTPGAVVLPAELDEIVAKLKTFYDTAVTTGLGQGTALGVLLSGDDVSTELRRIKIRKRQAIKPEPVLREEVYNSPTGSGVGGFPHEVAMCLSYRGQLEAGGLQRRRRGRIYLGPLNDQAGNISRSAGDVRPSDRARAIVAAAGKRLRDDPGAVIWATYSTVDGFAVPVVNGWVDNAYDTQRRRGTKPTQRTTW